MAGCSPGFSLGLLSLVQVGLIQVSADFVKSLCLAGSFIHMFFSITSPQNCGAKCNEISASREQERLHSLGMRQGVGGILAVAFCFMS